jgi:hypothetical protein
MLRLDPGLTPFSALIAAGCSKQDAQTIVKVAREQMREEFNVPGF